MKSLRLCGDVANVANLNCVRKHSGVLMKISVSVKILQECEDTRQQHVRVHSEFIAVVKLDVQFVMSTKPAGTLRANRVTWCERQTVLQGTVCAVCTVFVLP